MSFVFQDKSYWFELIYDIIFPYVTNPVHTAYKVSSKFTYEEAIKLQKNKTSDKDDELEQDGFPNSIAWDDVQINVIEEYEENKKNIRKARKGASYEVPEWYLKIKKVYEDHNDKMFKVTLDDMMNYIDF